MLQTLFKCLPRSHAHFSDLRYEETETTTIICSGGTPTKHTRTRHSGCLARTSHQGNLASAAFQHMDEAGAAFKNLRTAVAHSHPRHAPGKSIPTRPAIRDQVRPRLDGDPRRIPARRKQQWVQDYHARALAGHPAVTHTRLTYCETHRKKYYVNTEGSQIRQDQLTLSIKGEIYAEDSRRRQSIRVAVGGSSGVHHLKNRGDLFRDKARICGQLLQAPGVDPGNYTVLLDNHIGGLFIHETIGHLSEADFTLGSPLETRLEPGRSIAAPHVSIVDDPTLPQSLSHYHYDDEGTPAAPTCLVHQGRVAHRLHSRHTAAIFNAAPTGNALAQSHAHPPLVRMSNIYLVPGKQRIRDLLAEVDNGLYVCGANGGQTQGDCFSFKAQYGHRIKDGKPKELVRDIHMSGQIFDMLHRISLLGNDLRFSESGACRKRDQLNIRSCYGAPHMVVRGMDIGV